MDETHVEHLPVATKEWVELKFQPTLETVEWLKGAVPAVTDRVTAVEKEDGRTDLSIGYLETRTTRVENLLSKILWFVFMQLLGTLALLVQRYILGGG